MPLARLSKNVHHELYNMHKHFVILSNKERTKSFAYNELFLNAERFLSAGAKAACHSRFFFSSVFSEDRAEMERAGIWAGPGPAWLGFC